MYYSSRKSQLAESGVALVELSLVLPFLLIFFIVGAIEVGNMVVSYQKLNLIVNEGVRLGAKTNNLESGIVSSTDKDFSSVSATHPEHLGMHQRVSSLMEMQDVRYSSFTVSSEVRTVNDCSGGVCLASFEDTVSVRVTAQYDAFFPIPFDSWPISVERTSPWLYGAAISPEF